ncbi:uncharacterized protein LOC117125111 [Anneissia japonica]|uniref:uncharacterized protein LOC117125111 n=1 Tax=Anneissia japonica TaxID=1529436 RepID=UPI001425993E|nr:uncharacterized protein LOC117125111 [Anneissia japonica]
MPGGIKLTRRFYLMLMLNNVIYKVVAGGWTHTKDGLADINYVRPYHSTASGKFISHDIFAMSENKLYPNQKQKSDTTPGIKSAVVQHYTIKLDDELLVMSLTRDSRLTAEAVEDINRNMKNRIPSKCLLIGSVINDLNSRVVIDNCDGAFVSVVTF